MKDTQMAAETTGMALGLKSGLIGGGLVLAASALGTIVGFKVVPLTEGRELDDAATRMLCGFLSSCTLGFYSAYKFMAIEPGWLEMWRGIYAGHAEQQFLALLSAGLPFVALAALPGFWLVAAFMAKARAKAKELGGTP